MITITTDFGYEDHYVGVMKGVIKKINSKAEIVDITHGIRRHDIRHAAYVLRCILDYFPEDTVHLFVVDPGVGTGRRGIVAELDRGIYVGPDNGILTLVKNRVSKLYEIKKEANMHTFHGRDIFAPMAAQIDAGSRDELVEIDDFKKFEVQDSMRVGDTLVGEIIHVDHFGNVITNINGELVKNVDELLINGLHTKFVKSYGYAKEGELVALVNSENLLEFAVNKGDASKNLNVKVGDKIKLIIR